MKTILFILTFGAFSIIKINAQTIEKCATDYFAKKSRLENPQYLNAEIALENRIAEFLKNNKFSKQTSSVFTIPVVVHIIHSGEAIGTGSNISDAQIYSQLNVLNNDFRKRNSDSLLSSHPFSIKTADCEIEFCLANQDPYGNSTNGIIRFNGIKSFWEVDSFNKIIKPKTIWNPHDYLNIWVVNFGGTSASILGYGSLPVSISDSTDGLVVRHQAFGTIGTAGTGSFSSNNKGRTATHEIGHYFNLRHVWGSGPCGDDFVADTEPAETSNSGCPTFPQRPNNSCGCGSNGEMYMNFMDYTNDNCMVMFTQGQKARMNAVLSLERSSLLLSKGCTPVTSIAKIMQNKLTLFPNPAVDYINIQAEKNTILKVIIFNIWGKKVLEMNAAEIANSGNSIDIKNLPEGNYYLQIATNWEVQNHKITVI